MLTHDDLGCIIASDHGVRASLRLVEWAIGQGFPLGTLDTFDLMCLFEWATDNYTIPDEARDDVQASEAATMLRQQECMTVVDDISDDCIAWLNENIVPDGALIGWHDGEVMFWGDEDWKYL